MALVIQCVTKKYAEFSSRASRKEYWLFVLFFAIAGLGLCVVDMMVGTWDEESSVGVFSGIFGLVTFIPYLAVSVRRFHDTDRRGWWLLLGFVPLGIIWTTVVTCLEGSDGENRFGADPLTTNGKRMISASAASASPNTVEPRNNHSKLLLVLVGITIWIFAWQALSPVFAGLIGMEAARLAIFSGVGWAIIPAIICVLNDSSVLYTKGLGIIFFINSMVILILHIIIFIYVSKIHRGK
jgi:uncharacterized membrane protein YhaH (DUF805 family)